MYTRCHVAKCHHHKKLTAFEKDISFICSMEHAFHINMNARKGLEKKKSSSIFCVFRLLLYAVYIVVN